MADLQRRRFLVLTVLVAAMVISPVAASAIPAGGDPPTQSSGDLTSSGLTVSIGIAGNNEPPTSSPPPPYRWALARWPLQAPCLPGQIHYYAWRIDNATGWDIRFYRLAAPPAGGRDPAFGENTPINPGDFDTALEVWFVHVCYGPPTAVVEAAALASEALPPPDVGLSPDATTTGGLAGLETWMWHDYDRARYGSSPSIGINLPVTDPGSGVTYTITGSAWATGYEWLVVDGGETFTYSVHGPGAEGGADAASAVHMFEVKGPNEVTMSSEWVGEYQISGYTGTEVLGPVTIGSTILYPTIEVLPVLTYE